MALKLNENANTKEFGAMEGTNGNFGHLIPENQKAADIGTDFSYTHKIHWPMFIGLVALHVGGIIGIFWIVTFRVHPLTTIYTFVLLPIQFFGVTMGAHRYFSHRSFKANNILRKTLIFLYLLNGEHSIRRWVQDHRQHHKYSDTDADPHNSKRGFFFSHIGWLVTYDNPKVIQYRNTIYTADVDEDPWLMMHYKYLYLIYILFIIIPCIFPVTLWNEDMIKALFVCFGTRNMLSLNMVFTINSFAHMFGTRPFDKSLCPTQNLFVAIVAFGDGWHNYHHAFPYDYKQSELGMPFNWSANMIDFCAKMGWAYDLKEATEKTIISRIMRTGDISKVQKST